MKRIHTLVLLLYSIHSFAMQSIPHQKVDHSTCTCTIVSFVLRGETFFKKMPQPRVFTSQGPLYLCRHADKVSPSLGNPRIPRHILCNGNNQFISTQSTYGAPITILINDEI